MTRERYNELNEEFEKLPDKEDALDAWSESLGEEYDTWCDLGEDLDSYLKAKVFELHINHTMMFSQFFGFDTKKIKPLLNDMDFLNFVHSMWIAGKVHSDPDDFPQKEEWVDEYFKTKGGEE